jgi:pimeloyl-ACP methyl ester carboxylesterase
MKKIVYYLLVAVTLIACSHLQQSKQPLDSPTTFVIVHGAWGGGWAFKTVDSLLRAAGSNVYRPTLTGLGEKVHLASPDIGLYTHIEDIKNMILYEKLHNVVLVGYSYGGMVVTGVADAFPHRIKKLIYIDAFVPSDGESVASIQGGSMDWMRQIAVDGFIPPIWVKPDALPPKDVPQTMKTLTDTISLKNADRMKIPTTYILTVAKGTAPENDDFFYQSERARQLGWPVITMEADHNPQRSAPETLVKLLLENK